MSDKYNIIYCDPPWHYRNQQQHSTGGRKTGGAVSHYSCLKLKDLKNLPIKEITDKDCLIFMWSSSPHLDQAIDLMKAWGFKYATIAFVWDKMRVNPWFYTMSQCEICLVGKMGKIPFPRGARNIRQLVTDKRRAHSQKPDEVRKRIEQMFPEQSKIELFARGACEGWDVWGDEVESSISFPEMIK